MRLTFDEINCIKNATKRWFGKNARVWLFGSRTDNTKRGGDIDLYIETDIKDAAKIVKAKLEFLIELQAKIGEQKIDVVLHRKTCKQKLKIYQIAKTTGILL